MTTLRQVVYMVNDLLKKDSDDSFFTEDHIIYLVNKARVALLNQKYLSGKKEINTDNYQTLYLPLEKISDIKNGFPINRMYLKSIKNIPDLLTFGHKRLYSTDYYQGDIAFIPKERMVHIGYNKFLKNTIYASKGDDNYIYLYSHNAQFLHLTEVRLHAIFSDSLEASYLESPYIENPLDRRFALEDGLINMLVETVSKELLSTLYNPEDNTNNNKDDLSKIAIQNKQ